MTDNTNEVTVDNSVPILIDDQPWVAFGVNSIEPSLLSNNLDELDRRGKLCRTRTQEEQMEKPIDLVSRFCAAWANDLGAEDLAAFFTDDAVYHNIPFEPVTGKENIADNIASFIRPGPPG